MRLEQLHYLIALSKYPSLSAAAEKMHVSHQAMSAAIKALEIELDAQLIVRSFSGVTLTADGRYLVKIAQEFCQKLAHFLIASGPAAADLCGKLSIVSSQMALEGLLPKIIANFYTEHPQVQIQTTTLKPQEVVTHYENSQADLAFLALYRPEGYADFLVRPEITFVPCLNLKPCIEVVKTHPLAANRTVSLKQLRQQCILYNCPEQVAHDAYNRWPFAFVKGRKSVCEPNRSIYNALLLNGCGVGISMLLKSRPINSPLPDLDYIPLQIDGDYWLGYLVKEGRPFSEIASCFLQYLQNYYPPLESTT